MPPLPEELRERAAQVLAMQREGLAAAVEARAEVGRRLAALRAVPAPVGRPVYVDAVG